MVDDDGIDAVVGVAHARELMEEAGVAVYRLEVGCVVFLNPHRVCRAHLRGVGNAEVEGVLGVLVADGQLERRTVGPLVQQQRVLTLDGPCPDGECVVQGVGFFAFVHMVDGTYLVLHRTLDGGAGTDEDEQL